MLILASLPGQIWWNRQAATKGQWKCLRTKRQEGGAGEASRDVFLFGDGPRKLVPSRPRQSQPTWAGVPHCRPELGGASLTPAPTESGPTHPLPPGEGPGVTWLPSGPGPALGQQPEAARTRRGLLWSESSKSRGHISANCGLYLLRKVHFQLHRALH